MLEYFCLMCECGGGGGGGVAALKKEDWCHSHILLSHGARRDMKQTLGTNRKQ